MIIADSSVWIDYLRRRESPVRAAMDALLSRDQVVMVGVVLAEVLQGVRSAREHNALMDAMRALPYEESTRETRRECGETLRNLRARGVTASLTDALIAALAAERGHEVYTLDGDFERIPGARLHHPRSADAG